ncbi:hypothetical protein [Gluconacetobacter tumulisoli]|uniref:Uncharacterized protein n=1 Tax=Gluconacetobacter tumulisoli TaxID=1286189 RepID=A0A7W4K8L0_9PROT|nr:hypothetical protein [Gluconacetobacter tumulisoli]MBB2202290.1 hypothetical protein [Gluconacetobacter tumulisoli]
MAIAFQKELGKARVTLFSLCQTRPVIIPDTGGTAAENPHGETWKTL